MTKNQKIAIGVSILALLGFFGFKSYAAKKNTLAPAKKRTGSIEVGNPIGSFVMPSVVLSRTGTRLRSDSSTSSKIVTTYQKGGIELVVIGDATKSDGVWYQVADTSGNSGWVRSDVVDAREEPKDPMPSIEPQPVFYDELAEFERISGFGDY